MYCSHFIINLPRLQSSSILMLNENIVKYIKKKAKFNTFVVCVFVYTSFFNLKLFKYVPNCLFFSREACELGLKRMSDDLSRTISPLVSFGPHKN